MDAVVTLLILALQLLNAVSANPNAPADLRAEATTVANAAILEANAELAQSNTPPIITSAPTIPAPIQTQTQPVFGNIPMTTTDMENDISPIDQSAITISATISAPDASRGNPFGKISLQARVLDKDGNTVDKAPIAMTLGDGDPVFAKIDTILSTETNTDHYHTFSYTPFSAGDYMFSFVSGNLSTSTKVHI